MSGRSQPTISLSSSGGHGARGDLDLSTVLLNYVATTMDSARLIRVYRPEPTVAFSRRESHLPGFDSAVTAAASLGFVPVVRPTGGRAVSYDQSCLVIDVVDPVVGRHHGNQAAFDQAAQAVSAALRGLGVDAFVGEIPGEYCPGSYSVNARHAVKMAGISQRVVAGARLISVMIPVGLPDLLVEVLSAVNHELGFPWDPGTFGSVDGEIEGVSFGDLSIALRTALSPLGEVDVPYHRFAVPSWSASSLGVGAQRHTQEGIERLLDPAPAGLPPQRVTRP